MRKYIPLFLTFVIFLIFLFAATILGLPHDEVGKAILFGAIFVMALVTTIGYTLRAVVQHIIVPMLRNLGKPSDFRPRLALAVTPTTDLEQISSGPYTLQIREGLQDREGLSFHVDGQVKGVRDDVHTITEANKFLDEMAEQHQIPTVVVADLRAQLEELFASDDDTSDTN